MNNLKDNLYGIDIEIQEIQISLYEYLKSTWSIEDTDLLDGYGRIYRNNSSEGKVIPEVYNAATKNYHEVYYNSKSCFFFIDANNQEGDGFAYDSVIDIVFMLNLNQIHVKENERTDEKAFTQIIQHLRSDYEGTLIPPFNHIKRIENVLSGFDITKLQTNDLQPLHVFSIRCNLEYFINDKC